MTPAGLTALAEKARAEHMQQLGLTPAPWHLAPPLMRTAWIATVALVVSAAREGEK